MDAPSSRKVLVLVVVCRMDENSVLVVDRRKAEP